MKFLTTLRMKYYNSLFKSMHTAEYINFFRNQTDNRVTELQEEIAGIEKRFIYPIS